MGDPVLGLGEGLALWCTHPSLRSPEGLRLRRKPDLSTDLCIVGHSGRLGGGGATLSGACRLMVASSSPPPFTRVGEPRSRFISLS